nr:general secretion pathway protein GspB [Candidatus Omnitrophota bacterium]
MLKNIDKKQKIEITITAIGIVFLIGLLLTNISKPRKVEREPSMVQVPLAAISIISPATSADEYTSMASWDKDPFYPEAPFINSGSGGIAGVILNGIVWDVKNSYAIINNEIVKLGDKVNEMTVVEINEKNVVLDENGQRYTLELNVY